MSARIYQSYYKQEQKEHLDPEFYHYDNTSNPVNNLYEHYLYHRIREISIEDGIDRWGMFSWQWRKKIAYPIEVGLVMDCLEKTDYDVCLFNAYPDDEIITYNVWEQGAWSHPYIVYLGKQLLTIMGEDPKLVKMPMDKSVYLAANYFIGTTRFWNGLLEFLDRFVEAIPKLNKVDTQMLHSSANYGPNPNLDYTGFLCERMISTYIVRNQLSGGREDGYQMTVASWTPGTHPLSEMKHEGVQTVDRALMVQWDDERTPFVRGPKLGTEWINEVFPRDTTKLPDSAMLTRRDDEQE